jgi:hypothetical protein
MSAVPTIDTKATVVAERRTERQIAAANAGRVAMP